MKKRFSIQLLRSQSLPLGLGDSEYVEYHVVLKQISIHDKNDIP